MLREQRGRRTGYWAAVLAATALLWLGAATPRPAGADEAAGQGNAAPTVAPAVTLPSGDIYGTVTGSGGADLPTGLAVLLVDPATGAEVAGTLTDADGSYVLTDVPAGVYVLHVGEPGLVALIEVTEGAEAGALDVLMPALLLFPAPAGGPPGLAPTAAPAMAVAGEGGTTLVAAPILPAADQSAAAASAGGGPPGGGPPRVGMPFPHPGNPKPPVPPGRPSDKPLPPPFVSPTSP